ncbi:hypothetical protein G3T36_12490 [Diaminobutyricibacter tongyongensis]|uniref:MFS transporter permease n=1 Tax=Leifsonia tongyongensis TaxID=1268043 RepID=A0A6L9XZF3_9MICO|nr:hypothetical protein [Diaminobutyricibacter tongyongensis]
MILRRAFYWWLFPSAVILPAWLLVGWAIFGGGGWTFLGLLIACPVLFIAMLVIGGIVRARRSVRDAKAVSWYDVGLLAAWHLSIIAFGFFIAGVSGWIAVLGILLGLATFWVSLWELLVETRERVQQTFDAYERAAQPGAMGRPDPGVVDGGEYIVIEERRDDE